MLMTLWKREQIHAQWSAKIRPYERCFIFRWETPPAEPDIIDPGYDDDDEADTVKLPTVGGDE